jgi:hypothetical protein
MPGLTTLHVDFNDFDDDGRLEALARPGLERSLQVGEEVELRDGDGNSCQGHIERIDGRIAYVSLDWDTWTPSPPTYHLEPQGWWAITTDGNFRRESQGVTEPVIGNISGNVEDLGNFGRTGNSADSPSRRSPRSLVPLG